VDFLILWWFPNQSLDYLIIFYKSM
jgi:hypothetical protein